MHAWGAAHRVGLLELLLDAQQAHGHVEGTHRLLEVVGLQVQVRHVHVRRLAERVDRDGLRAALDRKGCEEGSW